MSKLHLTNQLKGDFGETIYENYCREHKYAYISLEEIYNDLTPKNVLIFRYGADRITVQIPDSVADEIRIISKPKNIEERPYFVFDYLAVSLWNNFEKKGKIWYQLGPLKDTSFSLVEVKTNRSRLSFNQKDKMEKINMKFNVFRIIADFPEEYEIEWEIKQ